jgi:hypothetical protein
VSKGGSVRDLVGERSKGPPDPGRVLNDAQSALDGLRFTEPAPADSMQALKRRYSALCRTYYTAAAVSRRSKLPDETRSQLLAQLFPLRVRIERAIDADLREFPDPTEVLKFAASKSFFGVSAKQGVSIRYALASCMPTARCGGRCYAHDGRDREIHHIFRGVLNYYFGSTYEGSDSGARSALIARLLPWVRYAVQAANAESKSAEASGFMRQPRIRFSHIGEMAATPAFCNDLASAIRCVDSVVQCVIYSRHPLAQRLDPKLFVVNFTIEGESDARRAFAPMSARIVNSSWDGRLSAEAAVNFLEHHVGSSTQANGIGKVCPVTVAHDQHQSCDGARCDLCFRPLMDTPG